MGDSAETGFGPMVRRVLTQRRQIQLKELAQRMGLSYVALYSRLRGRSAFRPEEIRTLLAEAPDRRLVDWLLADSPFVALERASPEPAEQKAGLMECGIRSLAEITKLVEAIHAASAAGGMNAETQSRIENPLLEAERTLMLLRRGLRQRARFRAA